MEQVMYKSSPNSPQGSIRVIQLEEPTFWAASWPVAMYIAVIMLAAWALNPPKNTYFKKSSVWQIIIFYEGLVIDFLYKGWIDIYLSCMLVK